MTKQKTCEPATLGTGPAATRPGGKLATMVALLQRPQGARLDEMQIATGWQAHSVRGAMSGALKGEQGHIITSEKTDAGRVYRIAQASAA